MPAQRLELSEREIAMSQSAEDRRAESGWEVWTNDAYWVRRLEKLGCRLIEKTETGGATFQLDQRQILIRKLPVPRKRGADVTENLRRRASREVEGEDLGELQ